MKCKMCRYFGPADLSDHMFLDGDGICRRFPQTMAKHSYEWCGEHKGKPVPKKDKPKNTGANEVIAYYCETYKEKFGVNPTIAGKDTSSAIRMLKNHTTAEINQHVMEFFKDTPLFYSDNHLFGLNHVESAWDKMVIKRIKMGENTGDELTYESMLNEQVIAWGNHDKWEEYKQYVNDTHELALFENWLAEFYGGDDG